MSKACTDFRFEHTIQALPDPLWNISIINIIFLLCYSTNDTKQFPNHWCIRWWGDTVMDRAFAEQWYHYKIHFILWIHKDWWSLVPGIDCRCQNLQSKTSITNRCLHLQTGSPYECRRQQESNSIVWFIQRYVAFSIYNYKYFKLITVLSFSIISKDFIWSKNLFFVRWFWQTYFHLNNFQKAKHKYFSQIFFHPFCVSNVWLFIIITVPSYQLAAPVVKSRGYNAIVLTWLAATDIDITGYKVSFYYYFNSKRTYYFL